jgi:hypothetical protein
LRIAPPFRTLHERYPVENLEEALSEGIVTGHPTMPEFRLDVAQINDFIPFWRPSNVPVRGPSAGALAHRGVSVRGHGSLRFGQAAKTAEVGHDDLVLLAIGNQVGSAHGREGPAHGFDGIALSRAIASRRSGKAF